MILFGSDLDFTCDNLSAFMLEFLNSIGRRKIETWWTDYSELFNMKAGQVLRALLEGKSPGRAGAVLMVLEYSSLFMHWYKTWSLLQLKPVKCLEMFWVLSLQRLACNCNPLQTLVTYKSLVWQSNLFSIKCSGNLSNDNTWGFGVY